MSAIMSDFEQVAKTGGRFHFFSSGVVLGPASFFGSEQQSKFYGECAAFDVFLKN